MGEEWDLRPPAFHTAPPYEHTFGPQVVSVCSQAGFEPDPEQALILDDLFAVDETGSPVAYETCVIAPRQALKTGVMKMAAIGWLFVTEEETTSWSAHLFSTTQEAYLDLAALFSNVPMFRKRLATLFSNVPMFRKRLANDSVGGIHGGNADKHILLRDDRRLLFRSRTRTGGRGLTGDKIILDEAFALEPEHIGTLLPTLTVVPDPQILYGSSAGTARSAILREIRTRGRAGAPSLAYAEWCAPRKSCGSETCQHHKPSHPKYDPRCALDDEELLCAAYPLLGRRRANGTGLTMAKLRKFRESEPPEEWMRERMGWWDEPGAADVFGAGRWEACSGSEPPSSLPVGGLGLAVSFDQSYAALVAGAVEGDLVHVKPLHHEAGTSWVVNRARELQDRLGAPLILDGKGPGADLVPFLEEAGVDVQVINTGQVLDACAGLYGLVRDGRFRHADYPELEAAVGAAQRRDVGDRWAWGRRTSSADISALEAATWAAWWVSRPPEKPFESAYADRDPVMI